MRLTNEAPATSAAGAANTTATTEAQPPPLRIVVEYVQETSEWRIQGGGLSLLELYAVLRCLAASVRGALADEVSYKRSVTLALPAPSGLVVPALATTAGGGRV